MSGVARPVAAAVPEPVEPGRQWFTYVRLRGQVREKCGGCSEDIADFTRVTVDTTVLDWRGVPPLVEKLCFEKARTE